MIQRITRIMQKIKESIREYGLLGTLAWLWNCVVFKICVVFKLRLPNGTESIKWPDFDEYILSREEKKYLTMKEGRKVFILAGVPYYDIGGGQRCAQLAKAFNRLGYRVYYYYAFPSGDFKRENYVPIPCACHVPVSDLTVDDFMALAKADDMLIVESPADAFVPYVLASKELGVKVVYENIDNWESSLAGSFFSNRQTMMTIVKESDVLVGTAKLLVDQLHSYCKELGLEKPVLYQANAVDDELFSALRSYELPEDMVLGSKTLLYYGSLWGEWFDWDLVYGLAKHDPTLSINLIGGHPDPRIMGIAPENVHFLGLKKQPDLPAYLKYADFALIPFKTGDIGDYVSPLKIFEYISAGKNVLTTALPDIKGYPNMYSGNDLESWIHAVETATEPDLAAAEAFTAANTWDNRVQGILDAVYPAEARRCDETFYGKISIVVLNYNNKNIIDKCVASLLRARDRYAYEIVVVDNQSKDGSYEQLQERFGDEITLVRNHKNGCSSGRNLGVQVSKGDYIVFLDSDQWVSGRYWLDGYFEVYHRAPNFGAVGWASGWFNKEGAAEHVTDAFVYNYVPPVGLCRPDIGYLATCGVLMEKKLFEEIGGFDEYYDPTCYEDTDLSLAIRHAGKELYHCRSVGVNHLPHQTTKSGTEGHKRLLDEKQQYFTAKWKKLHPELLNYIKEL